MPHNKSCKKRLKTNEKSRVYNKAYTSQMRSQLKAFRAIEAGDDAKAGLPELVSLLDRMKKKGILKANRVSRLKSRLQIKANNLSG
ncbi:MAG: 30S ribosomal protein S20 [bacterium]|nr:30S ribosomal protein S20 [bacterium]